MVRSKLFNLLFFQKNVFFGNPVYLTGYHQWKIFQYTDSSVLQSVANNGFLDAGDLGRVRKKICFKSFKEHEMYFPN